MGRICVHMYMFVHVFLYTIEYIYMCIYVFFHGGIIKDDK